MVVRRVLGRGHREGAVIKAWIGLKIGVNIGGGSGGSFMRRVMLRCAIMGRIAIE